MTEENIFLSLWGSGGSGDNRHAMEIMKELSIAGSFEIKRSVPQSIADGWHFTISYEKRPELPAFINRDLPG